MVQPVLYQNASKSAEKVRKFKNRTFSALFYLHFGVSVLCIYKYFALSVFGF